MSGGLFYPGGFCPGGFCPVPHKTIDYNLCIRTPESSNQYIVYIESIVLVCSFFHYTKSIKTMSHNFLCQNYVKITCHAVLDNDDIPTFDKERRCCPWCFILHYNLISYFHVINLVFYDDAVSILQKQRVPAHQYGIRCGACQTN